MKAVMCGGGNIGRGFIGATLSQSGYEVTFIDVAEPVVQALQEMLNKEIDTQRQKIDTLRSALKNASDSFGENDRRTQNWQIQLNNATAALNDMERELSDNEKLQFGCDEKHQG